MFMAVIAKLYAELVKYSATLEIAYEKYLKDRKLFPKTSQSMKKYPLSLADSRTQSCEQLKTSQMESGPIAVQDQIPSELQIDESLFAAQPSISESFWNMEESPNTLAILNTPSSKPKKKIPKKEATNEIDDIFNF